MSETTSLVNRVFSSTSKISLSNSLAKAVALLASFVLSRWLGPAPFGVYSLAATFVGLASTCGLLGLDMAYARYYLDPQSEDRFAVEAFCWSRAAAAGLIAAMVATLIWLFVSQRFVHLDRISVAVFLPFSIVFSVLSTMAMTRARLQLDYNRLAISLFLSTAVASLLSLLLTAAGLRGVSPLLLGSFTTSAMSVLILGVPKLKCWHLNPKRRREMLNLGLSCAVTAPLYLLISSVDRWFLAVNVGEAELGVYSIASTIALAGMIVNSSVNMVLFPEASRLEGVTSGCQNVRVARLWEQLAVLLMLVMVLVGSAGGPLLQLLTPFEFHGGAAYVPWLACGVCFYGLASLSNLPFFLVGKMNSVIVFWVLASAICFILNWLLIPRFGALGASVVQMSTYLSVCVMTFIGGRGIMKMPLRLGRLSLALTISVFFLISLVSLPVSDPWSSLILSFGGSSLLGLVLALLISPDIVKFLFDKISALCDLRYF